MRRLLCAALVAASLVAAPAADAHPNYHYEGGCSLNTAPDGDNGSQTTWTGTADVTVLATDSFGAPAPAPINAECHLYVNGGFAGVLVAASGYGFATNSTLITYQAHPSDVLTLCDAVGVADEWHTSCDNVSPPPPPPPPPTTVPAYGKIIIADAGAGATMTTTYDPALWSCSFSAGIGAATATCSPNVLTTAYTCPLMILTTATELTGKAGGRVECHGGGPFLDTGVVAGTNAVTLNGNLGSVTTIRCEAYAGFPGVLVPPYKVTCNEPGAPEVRALR